MRPIPRALNHGNIWWERFFFLVGRSIFRRRIAPVAGIGNSLLKRQSWQATPGIFPGVGSGLDSEKYPSRSETPRDPNRV